MGVTKKDVALSLKHVEMMESMRKALQRASAGVIAEAKALYIYLVVSDAQGNIKKIPAKDL